MATTLIKTDFQQEYRDTLSTNYPQGFVDSSDCRQSRGQVGTEAMIVFIALILVAMLSAGVLISMSGFLQNKAQSTGEQSTDQVSNRLSVISTHVNETTVSVDTVSLSNERVRFTNYTKTISNDTDQINQDGGNEFVADVSSGDSVLLQGKSDTLTVNDGDELLVVNKSTGGWEIANDDTSESIDIDDSSISVVDDSDGTSDETFGLQTQAGESVSVVEGTSEDFDLREQSTRIVVEHTGTVTASVNSGGDVNLSTWSFTDEITVYDGDTLTVRHTSGGDVEVTNENNSQSITTSYPLLLANDTDGTTGEKLTLTNASGRTVKIDEDTDGTAGSTTDENYELDTRVISASVVNDTGKSLNASVSSSGSVTVSDGSSTLTVFDTDRLTVERSAPSELTLTNQNTSSTLVTTSETIEVVSDGDGTTGETLELSDGTEPTVNSSESNDRQFRISFGSRSTSEESETVNITVMRGPGADAVDVGAATIRVVGPNASTFVYSGSDTAVTDEQFGVAAIKDEDETLPVLTSSEDRFQVQVEHTVPEDEEYTLIITTASGATVRIPIEADADDDTE